MFAALSKNLAHRIERLRMGNARPVATWVDANYGPAACVMLTSLYLNNPDTRFDTFVFTPLGSQGVKQPNFEAAFEELRQRFGRRIVVRNVDDQALAALPLHPLLHYLNRATFGNLLLPALVPAKSFLYLDSDVVVQDDIAPLLRLDLGTHLIAAVADYGDATAWAERLGVAATDAYVNNGVMLVNAQAWRRENVIAEIWRQGDALGGRAVYADQDMLNVATMGRKLLLEPKWNCMQHALLLQDGLGSFDADSFRGILHYTWLPKPWENPRVEKFDRLRRLYRRYAERSPLAL